ncbi:MAG: hypothetical protein Crog4KO_35350 [Crocinitomicaceae bacterium]
MLKMNTISLSFKSLILIVVLVITSSLSFAQDVVEVPADSAPSTELLARTSTELLLRAAPDMTATVIGSVSENTYLSIVARSPENDWLQAQYQGGFVWISRHWLDLQGNVEDLPLAIDNTNVTLGAVVPANFERILVHTTPSQSANIVLPREFVP